MSHSRVGLAIVDTESYALANNAVQACVDRFNFHSVNILTNATEYWPQFTCTSIPKIKSIDDYNRIVLKILPEYIQEEFCIIAQYDGFIINGDAFNADFYKFDYIGAVWPNYPCFRVGNGGFSWRSKKLMDAVATLSHLRLPGEAEDLFICRTLRVILEDRFGCIFADEYTANLFSYEIVSESRASFGFHGVFNLPIVYRNNLKYLVDNLPRRILLTRMPFLQHGVNQLSPSQQEEFKVLISHAKKNSAVGLD